jgi:D-alanine-D-alanine ligase
MRKLRVLVLVHESLVPPDDLEGHTDKEIAEWKTEYDVITTLRQMGHDVRPLGLSDELGELRRNVLEWKPHVAFNLLEEFHGVATYDQHVVSYLELLRQPYTGCNPRGLLLAHDKALCKKILMYHRVLTPRFMVFPRGRAFKAPARSRYPLFVKSATEEASLGIAQASIVHQESELRDRVAFVHEAAGSDALAEEYVEGRELYVGVIGNRRLDTFPPWEMTFDRLPEGSAPIATRKAKWDHRYQERVGVATGRAKKLPDGVEKRLARLSRRIYRILQMTGYARLDFRLTEDGRLFVLEANPNPNLCLGEDFADSAEAVGIGYQRLLHRIVTLGMSYRPEWMGV